MADSKYKLKKGETRTPEEYRRIQKEIDDKQKENSAKGVKKSYKRIQNTFGVSSTQYKKKRKPKNVKPRIYDQNRYIQNMGIKEYRE